MPAEKVSLIEKPSLEGLEDAINDKIFMMAEEGYNFAGCNITCDSHPTEVSYIACLTFQYSEFLLACDD